MKIAIVVINWNGLELLKKYLKKIINNSPDQNVYLIDNNSKDESIKYVRENHNDVKIISLVKNYGFAEGYNIGIQQVKEDYICIINNDVEVTKDWLNPIKERFKDYPNSIIQPKILDINNTNYFEYAGAAGGFIDKYGYPYCRGRIFYSIEEDNNQYLDKEIFWSSGACMFVSKKIFTEIGGFDKTFFAHMEEIDFCWRAFNHGYSVHFISSSKVYHEGAATIKMNYKKTYLNYRNSLFMLTKNLPLESLISTLIIRLIMDIISSFRFLVHGEISNFLSVYRAHFDYFIKVKKLLRDRNSNLNKPNYFKINRIVYKYYILGKKKFFHL
jgi:GT2 family glycosyltransferase